MAAKHPICRFCKTVAVLGAIAGIAYLAVRRSRPTEDPWAEAYWEDVKTEQDS